METPAGKWKWALHRLAGGREGTGAGREADGARGGPAISLIRHFWELIIS